jgi:hypothetical protein
MVTRRRAIRIALGFSAGVGAIRAGADVRDGFWERKPPSEWTADEISRITTDSPWAHSPTVYAVRDLRDRPWSERSPLDLPRADKARGILGRWESARVIQDALHAKPNDDVAEYYLIHLSENSWITRSLRETNKLTERLQELRHYSKLQPRYRSIGGMSFPDGVAVDHVEELLAGPSRGIVFYFPRRAPITLEEKEVRFVTVIDSFRIELHFTLKDMVYHGELAL